MKLKDLQTFLQNQVCLERVFNMLECDNQDTPLMHSTVYPEDVQAIIPRLKISNVEDEGDNTSLGIFNDHTDDERSLKSDEYNDKLRRQASKRSYSMPRIILSAMESDNTHSSWLDANESSKKEIRRLSFQEMCSNSDPSGSDVPRQNRYVRNSTHSTLRSSKNELSKSSILLNNIGAPSEMDCKSALKKWAKTKFGMRTRCVREMVIKDVRMKKAYQYSLETFLETRDINVEHEPCSVVVNKHRPTTSSLWDLECKPDSMFHSSKGRVEVPGSAELVVCTKCEGVGFDVCPDCNGKGLVDCIRCEGTGYKLTREPLAQNLKHGTCYYCAADGTVKCMFCEGRGRRKCPDCHGQRTLKKFLQLTVRFTNVSTSQIVSERMDLLEERLNKVSGLVICERESLAGEPLSDFPHLDVFKMSDRMLKDHQIASEKAGARILRQRQKVYLVPVTEVAFRWKGKDGKFWLYGLERKCFCPTYPQRRCSIL